MTITTVAGCIMASVNGAALVMLAVALVPLQRATATITMVDVQYVMPAEVARLNLVVMARCLRAILDS